MDDSVILHHYIYIGATGARSGEEIFLFEPENIATSVNHAHINIYLRILILSSKRQQNSQDN